MVFFEPERTKGMRSMWNFHLLWFFRLKLRGNINFLLQFWRADEQFNWHSYPVWVRVRRRRTERGKRDRGQSENILINFPCPTRSCFPLSISNCAFFDVSLPAFMSIICLCLWLKNFAARLHCPPAPATCHIDCCHGNFPLSSLHSLHFLVSQGDHLSLSPVSCQLTIGASLFAMHLVAEIKAQTPQQLPRGTLMALFGSAGGEFAVGASCR